MSFNPTKAQFVCRNCAQRLSAYRTTSTRATRARFLSSTTRDGDQDTSKPSQKGHGQNKQKSAVKNLTSDKTIPQPSTKKYSFTAKSNYRFTSVAHRPSQPDINWYWETFPPTIAEKARATHFFGSRCAKTGPKFLTSAARFMKVPDSDVPEVAFVGRSNSGKSSLLNSIVNTDLNELARTSATPGFTKTMNFYGIGPGTGVMLTKDGDNRSKIVGRGGLVIVDMPGYGEGSLSEWGVEIMKYIQSRKQLRRVFVLLDAEHGIKDKDRSVLTSLRLAGVSHQVILSKIDKIFIPPGNTIKHFLGNRTGTFPPKGTPELVREKMELLKPEIQPPFGGSALGEIIACSSKVAVDKQRIGLDHVRYAVLKAVGLNYPNTIKGRKAKDAADEALESKLT